MLTVPFNGGVCSREAASLARAATLLGICPALPSSGWGKTGTRWERGKVRNKREPPKF